MVTKRKMTDEDFDPRLWREPSDHVQNCYFELLTQVSRQLVKNAKNIYF